MQGDHPSTPGHYLDPRDRRTSRRTLQRARKALDAAHQKTNQGRGKDVERKSPKTDFPSQLANPAYNAGFALSHRLCFYWLTYETGHFICSQKRTFPLANDTLAQAAGSSTISAASGPSNSTGVVTFTVTDMKAEAVTYTATDSTDSVTITDTAIVTFKASKLAFTTAPFSVTATVCTTSAATVQTQDGNGTATNPPSSVTVTLSSSSTGTKAFYSNSSCGTTTTTLTIGTGANSANFWYKDTKAGSPVITAAATGGVTSSPTQTETVTAGPATAAQSTVIASPTSVIADGTSTSTITVTLMDANSNPVGNKTVTLTAGSGSSTIATVSGTTNTSGQATFTVKDSTAQAVVYTGKDTTDNVTVTQTATVKIGASKLAFTTASLNVTVGSCSPVTVTTEDANSNPADPLSTVNVAPSSSSSGGTFWHLSKIR